LRRLVLAAAAALFVCGPAGSAVGGSKLDIFRVGADGKGRIDLTAADPEPDTSPRVAPNGRTVAYARGDGRIWLMNADGTNQRPLTAEQDAGPASEPIWSPDGRRIAYDVVQVLPRPHFSVAVREVTTGNLVRTFDDARDPTWSSGGGRIVFEQGVSPEAGYSQALVSTTLAGAERTLTPTLNVLAPAWSPNGKLVAFYGVRAGASPGLYVVRPDGTGTRRLAGGGPASAPAPAPFWSPDSKQLTFGTDRSRVVVIALGTGRGRTLGHGVTPSWSPTGAKIANFAVEGALQVRSAKTGKGHLVTQVEGGWYLDPPAWSRDGKGLYFTSLSP
jgi:Tol biopolymer transport system component